MVSVADILAKLGTMEQMAGTDTAQLQEIETLYDGLCAQYGTSVDLLRARNLFRVKYAAHMQNRRPRILLGTINSGLFPNFHTVPLLRLADVVSLTTMPDGAAAADRLFINLFQDELPAVLGQLPEGFTPDLYWDPQICGASIPPLGLDRAPFLTAASFCHHHKTFEIENTARLYDILCPLSALYAGFFKDLFPEKLVLDLPFGVNWGSFREIVANPAGAARDIDILISFGDSETPEYGPYRRQCHDAANAFKAKYGDRFNLVAIMGKSRDDYIKYLARSKIALNAVGQHGPYNYRNCEAVNEGAVVMQINATFAVGDQKIERYFIPDQEIILFTPEDFEAKALALLENPDRLAMVAAAARARLDGEYAYETLYGRLFQEIGARMEGVEPPRLTPEAAAHRRTLALFHAPGARKPPYALAAVALADSVLGLQREAAYLAYFNHLELLNEETLSSLLGDRGLAKLVRSDKIRAMKKLFARIRKPGLQDRWNLAVHQALNGENVPTLWRVVLAELQKPVAATGMLSAESLIHLPPLLAPIPAAVFKRQRFDLLSTGYLLAGPDGARKDALIRQFLAFCAQAMLDAKRP